MEKITQEGLCGIKTKALDQGVLGATSTTWACVSYSVKQGQHNQGSISGALVSECLQVQILPLVLTSSVTLSMSLLEVSLYLSFFICNNGNHNKTYAIRFMSGNLEIIQVPSNNISVWLQNGQPSKFSTVSSPVHLFIQCFCHPGIS